MRFVLIAMRVLLTPFTANAETIRLYAAGCLNAALAVTPAGKIETTLGASGLLRERLEKGEAAHVSASADTVHPKCLVELGRAASLVAVFARNELCALVRSGRAVTTDNLLDTMLDAKVLVSTSPLMADPSGDCAFGLFGKAETIKAGAKIVLEAKALILAGGPASPIVPEDQTLDGCLMATEQADVLMAIG
jgi:molybdate transport system substrate-binding protein